MSLSFPIDKHLRLGFIGGSIESAVGYAHWVASQMDGVFDVVSGCFSQDHHINMQTAQEWGIASERVYDDSASFIEGEKDLLDAVVVLTPTPTHAEIVCDLLYAGYAVICEKAMVADLEQSRQVKEALDKTKGFLAVTFNYSGYPMVRNLRRHIEDGDLGKILQVHVEMPSDAFIQPMEKMHPQLWRLKDGAIPTMLLDLAVHVHHLTAFLTGFDPVEVNADFHHFSQFENIVDDAHIWARYEHDVHVNYWVSKTALGHRNGLRLRVFGDQGSAEWYQEEPERLHLFRKDSVRMTYDRGNCVYPEEIRDRFKPGHPAGFVEAFSNLYWDMALALVQYRDESRLSSPYVFGWEHADQGLRLLDAAVRANTSRQWQSLVSGKETS